MHDFLSQRAYAGPQSAPPCTPAALAQFRADLWEAGATLPDATLRAAFVARYPQAFDAWDEKRFLSLNPEQPVIGLDVCLDTSGSVNAQYGRASRAPDDDHRNQARFAYDHRVVRHDRFGDPVPADPATLDMGGFTGLSSQAHAHYGLAKVRFSDDPAVLKKDPRRFAIPTDVHTFDAEFAEMYTALAQLAASRPATNSLTLIFAGAAAHHVQDVANQIHTVQVGIYDFFVAAKLESIKDELLSVGGLLHPRRGFLTIGKQLLVSYHVLVESLFAKHLLAMGDSIAQRAKSPPRDAEFGATLDALVVGYHALVGAECAPGFGRGIAAALIERSSREGAAVYAEVWAVADHRYRKAGVEFTGGDPDPAITPGADLSHFYELQLAGVTRADQAIAAWWQLFKPCADSFQRQRIVNAFFRDRLAALAAEDARLAKYAPTKPPAEKVNVIVPLGYAVVLASAIAFVLRRRRARSAR